MAAIAAAAMASAAPAGGAKVKTIKGPITLEVQRQGGGSGLVLGRLGGNKVCAGGTDVVVRRDGQEIARVESFLNGNFQASLPVLTPGSYSAASLQKKDKLKGQPVRCAPRTSSSVAVV